MRKVIEELEEQLLFAQDQDEEYTFQLKAAIKVLKEHNTEEEK
jgi:hemerythrin superfamily protein